jgi:hypothetical protein
MQTLVKKIIPIACWVSFICLNAFAASGPVAVTVDIQAGDSKAIRLRNLPQNAVVAVKVESDGEIIVVMLDTPNYLNFSGNHRSLFVAKVQNRLAFSVTIPATDNYYIVLDNRTGGRSRSVKVMVNAAPSSSDQIKNANKILWHFEQQLHRVFVFDPFVLGVKQCGSPKAFIKGPGIVLCTEYLQCLYDTLKDRQMAQNAMAFSIFNEIARMLLSKWHHPLAGEAEIVKKIATVLMVMVNQEHRVTAISENFVKNPRVPEALMKKLRGDCHPFSAKQAKKILGWLRDPKFVHRWQPVLVPHMQTTLLERLYQSPTTWTDLSLVKKELAARRKNSPGQHPQVSPYKKGTAI